MNNPVFNLDTIPHPFDTDQVGVRIEIDGAMIRLVETLTNSVVAAVHVPDELTRDGQAFRVFYGECLVETIRLAIMRGYRIAQCDIRVALGLPE